MILACFSISAQEKHSTSSYISVVNTAAGKATELSWRKGEENIAYFIVERSIDGSSFKNCGIVFLSEDPFFTQYKFRDKINSESAQYTYRIGVVSQQKEVKFLPVIQISIR